MKDNYFLGDKEKNILPPNNPVNYSEIKHLIDYIAWIVFKNEGIELDGLFKILKHDDSKLSRGDITAVLNLAEKEGLVHRVLWNKPYSDPLGSISKYCAGPRPAQQSFMDEEENIKYPRPYSSD
ncbi:MAG: hypothetical protein ABH804_01050 [archaeon]